MISIFLFGICVVVITGIVVGIPAIGMVEWGVRTGPRWYFLAASAALLLFGVPAMVVALIVVLRPIAGALGVPW